MSSCDNTNLEKSIHSKDPDGIINSLKCNININSPDKSGKYLIFVLMDELWDHPALPTLIQKFIEAGMNLGVKNKTGDTPLMEAIKRSLPISIIQNLIEAGSDVNHRNNSRETPLSLTLKILSNQYYSVCVRNDLNKIISLLLNHNANVSTLTDREKHALVAEQIIKNPDENIVRGILRKWILSNYDKDILLEKAYINGKWKIVNDLVKMGADIDLMQLVYKFFQSYIIAPDGSILDYSQYDTIDSVNIISSIIKILSIIHPNPLVKTKYGEYVFDIIDANIKMYKAEIQGQWETDKESQGRLKLCEQIVKDSENLKKILMNYLYSWLRDLGGYFQSGILPTDLIKIIGDEIVDRYNLYFRPIKTIFD